MSSHRSHYDAALDLWHGRPSAATVELNRAAEEYRIALIEAIESGKLVFLRGMDEPQQRA